MLFHFYFVEFFIISYNIKTDQHSNYPLIHLKAVRDAKSTNEFQKSLNEWKETLPFITSIKKNEYK